MPREKRDVPTRQIYASIREDLYLAAKARATELRVPLRQLIESALEVALTEQPQEGAAGQPTPTIWDQDEYLAMQSKQPVGSPVELTPEEAQTVAKAAFGSGASERPQPPP